MYVSEKLAKYLNTYRKLQKIPRRKVLWFIGFYHNVRKTFVVLPLEQLFEYTYIGTQNGTYKLVGKTFAVLRESVKIAKVFFRIGFVVYGTYVTNN